MMLAGCCDCGDLNSWAAAGCCPKHRGDTDPQRYEGLVSVPEKEALVRLLESAFQALHHSILGEPWRIVPGLLSSSSQCMRPLNACDVNNGLRSRALQFEGSASQKVGCSAFGRVVVA